MALIMKRAHAIARKLEGDYRARISYALKQAHLEYTLGMLKTNSLTNLEFVKEVLENKQGFKTVSQKERKVGYLLSEINRMIFKQEKFNNKLILSQ